MARLRDEFLNETLFTAVMQARIAREDWRRDYNNPPALAAQLAGWRPRPMPLTSHHNPAGAFASGACKQRSAQCGSSQLLNIALICFLGG